MPVRKGGGGGARKTGKPREKSARPSRTCPYWLAVITQSAAPRDVLLAPVSDPPARDVTERLSEGAPPEYGALFFFFFFPGDALFDRRLWLTVPGSRATVGDRARVRVNYGGCATLVLIAVSFFLSFLFFSADAALSGHFASLFTYF